MLKSLHLSPIEAQTPDLFHRLFSGVPWILVAVPIVLLSFDVFFKYLLFKRMPHDSVADVCLGALTFNVIHLLTELWQQDGVSSTPARKLFWGVVWVGLQFCAWPAALFWSERLAAEGTRTRLLLLSYVAGITWFAYSTGRMLLLLP
jgi:hypothetical protein